MVLVAQCRVQIKFKVSSPHPAASYVSIVSGNRGAGWQGVEAEPRSLGFKDASFAGRSVLLFWADYFGGSFWVRELQGHCEARINRWGWR